MTVVGNMMVKYCSVNYIFERLLLLGAYPVNINMSVHLHCQSKRWGDIDIVAYLYYCLLLRIDVTY